MSDDLSNVRYPEAYGTWAGNPAGTPPDYSRCCETVSNRERFIRFYQCKKSRGFGPDKAYCKQHDPAAREKKREEADAKFAKKTRGWRLEGFAPRFLDVLNQIAAGHNDPRAIAKEVIAEFEK